MLGLDERLLSSMQAKFFAMQRILRASLAESGSA